MALTLKWWTDLKNHDDYKVDHKVAPETDFEKKLKIYDHLHADIESVQACDAAIAALLDVDKARASSMNALQKTFPKLAAQVSPNGGRLLTQKISDDKKLLAEKKKEVTAKRELGAPQMQGLGPGGDTIRKKSFDVLHGKIKNFNDGVRKTPQLEKTRVSEYLTYLESFAKDVALYCKDHPGAHQFQDDYVGAVAGFKKAVEKFGKKDSIDALKSAGDHLARMASANYVA